MKTAGSLNPTTLTMLSHSPRQTQKLGERLGETAQPGDVYLLVGELGSGKTCLAQGIARGLGVTEYTSSPSFVLMKEYHGRLAMYHMDLYRLDREAEMLDLGLESYFAGAGLCVVEWAEKLGRLMPEEHLLIAISYRGDRTRLLEMKARGKRYEERLASLVPSAKPAKRPEA
ncbi:MAG: tRNA (adenosine(37)-N6)-threonylcarbamoyltransferase complex ATPase subunit type 1 TsaE [Dehalococcoidia bacterium]|nr:tRNA (adenosine(37)-N6)-threonylcarbamoyltransferase complex ATPase subunit type 1 TsaE [Dehalococcoidia bacterium]